MPNAKLVLHRFTFLLIFLLAILVIYPYVSENTRSIEGEFIRFLYIGVFASAVYALSDTRQHLIIGSCLFLPIMILNIAGIFYQVGFMESLRLALSVLFSIYTLYTFLVFIFIRCERVTHYTLQGAVCVYLLMGLTWAMAYAFLEGVAPGSFISTYINPTDSILDFPNFIYYSFITLTTLGYGDILPVTLQAQSLSLLEAIAGILYTTILVARLIGIYLLDQRQHL